MIDLLSRFITVRSSRSKNKLKNKENMCLNNKLKINEKVKKSIIRIKLVKTVFNEDVWYVIVLFLSKVNFATHNVGLWVLLMRCTSVARSLFGSSAVKDSGGFSFGLGAPSGAAVTVPTSVPILSQSLPAPGFSFGMRSTEPGAFMQGSSPQSAFGSSSLPFSGFGQDYSQFSPNFGHSNAGKRLALGILYVNLSIALYCMYDDLITAEIWINLVSASHSLFGSSIPTKIVQENEMSNSLFPSQNSQPFGVTHVLDTSMNQFMTEVTNQK